MKKDILIALTAFFLAATVPAFAQQQVGIVRAVGFNEYLNKVAEDNLEYLSEKYNVRIADAEVAIQKVIGDPTLGFEAADDCYSLELGYTFELGKRTARVGVAKAEAEFEFLALEWFFQELRAAAADSYLEAMLQKELLDVRKSSYQYMKQLADYDAIRFRCGEINEIDAKQSSLEALSLLNESHQQEGEYLAALAELSFIMGTDSTFIIEPSGVLHAVDRNYDLGTLIQWGTINRVDLMAASKNLDIATYNLKLAKAERRPDLDVFVGYERDWNGFSPKRDMLKAGITIPLKFSNFNRASVKQAGYSVEQGRLNMRAAELQVRTEISQAYFRYQALAKQLEGFQSGMLDDAQRVLDGTVFRYKRGETDILDVLVAQRTFNEVREQYLETTKDYMSALIALQKCCGIWDIVF